MAIIIPATQRRVFETPRFSAEELLQGVETGDVLSVGLVEGFTGAGSGRANVDALLIGRDTGEEQNIFGYGIGAAIYYTGNFIENILGEGESAYERQPLTKEEWLESQFYRPDLEYKEGLTNQSARVMANVYDREQKKNFILSQASGWQTAGFYSSSILGSLPDPKSLLMGGVAAGAVRVGGGVYTGARAAFGSGAVGSATKLAMAGEASLATSVVGASIVRGNIAARNAINGFKTTKKSIAAEAALGTAIMAGTGFEAEKVLGREYGIEDVAVDFLASIGMSVGLHVIGGYIGKAWLKTSSANDIDVLSGIVEQQIATGKKVDVIPAVEAQMAERYIPLSNLAPNNRTPDVVQVGRKKQYEATYKNEQGIYAVVKGKGATPEEAIADLERIYQSGEVAAGQYNTVYTPEYYQEALRVQELNDQVSLFDIDRQISDEFKLETGETLSEAQKRIAELEQDVQNIIETRGVKKGNRATAKLEKEIKKFDDAKALATRKVNNRYSGLKKAQRDSQQALMQMQRDLAAPNFVGWVNKQLSDNPADNAAGLEGLSPQKYVDAANQVDEGSPEIASAKNNGEIEALKTIAQDENIPVSLKNIIDNQVKEVETSKKVYQVYQSFLLCKAR